MTGYNAPRLRRELLVRLMLPLLVLVGLSGVAATYVMQRLADRVYDEWLLDAASSLAAEVRFVNREAALELPPAARAMLSYDVADRVTFDVRQGRRTIAGDAELPASGPHVLRYAQGKAYDAMVRGQPLRVAEVEIPDASGTQSVRVRVAETRRKRERIRSEVLVMLLPLALLLVVAAATIGYAVRRTLRPLDVLAAKWSAHSHVSLELIDTGGVPRELLPFATALNELLSRLGFMLEQERQFSANIAHQLRTPLAGLLLGLSRAEATAGETETRVIIAELKQTTKRLGRLVQQLLALGRIGPDGAHTIDFVPTDLVALAQEVGSGFVELAVQRDITLELDTPSRPVIVRVHPDLVIEALSNVLDNAIRYTPRGGSVAVGFDSLPPAIIVSDSGPGIGASERERVVERFTRGSGAPDPGSGLGLAIVREIARLHGGEVVLRSAPQGGLEVVLRFASAASA